MYYILYETKNKINNKIYVGIHKTKELNKFDGYYGSGLLLNRSIEHSGNEKFTRRTLAVLNTWEDARELERKYVDEDFVKRKDTYNLSIGGTGGFTLCGFDKMTAKRQKEIQENRKRGTEAATKKRNQRIKNDEEFAKKTRNNMRKIRTQPDNRGKTYYHKGEHVIFVLPNTQPEGYVLGTILGYHNKNLGKISITDGKSNRFIDKDEILPEGWRRGKYITEDKRFKGHDKKTLDRMSIKRKNKIYATNGKDNKLFDSEDDIPNGWKRGLSHHKKRGRWITNGIESTALKENEILPEGWRYGRTYKRGKK